MMRTMVGLLLVGAVLCGCGGADQSVAGTAGDIDAGDVVGSTWTLRTGSGPAGPVPLVDGWPITVLFENQNFGGTAACNGYGGSYSIDGRSLSLRDLGSEDMGCPRDVLASQQAFFAAVEDVNEISIVDNELILSGGATQLRFTRAAAFPVDGVIGKRWLLREIRANEVVLEAKGEPALLMMSPDGSVTGSTGCRGFTGTYIIVGNEAVFTNFSMDGTACPPERVILD